MDLRLDSRAVLILGPGDALDRAMIRSLATQGAATLATHDGRQSEDLTQQGTSVSHWVSQEDDVNAFTALRLRQFLASQVAEPVAVVVHVDLVKAISRRRPVRWWHLLSRFDDVLQDTTGVALHASTGASRARVILVYRLGSHAERPTAIRWMHRTMRLVARKARKHRLTPMPVNSVLVGVDADFTEAAHIVTFLCSPLTNEISGAIIPVDGGRGLHSTP